MTNQEGIEQGKKLAAEIREFQQSVDQTTTFAMPGDKLIALCSALATSTEAMVTMLEEKHEKTMAVTDKEGGDWVDFADFRGGVIHSVKFADGQIWDCINGWRGIEVPPRFAYLFKKSA